MKHLAFPSLPLALSPSPHERLLFCPPASCRSLSPSLSHLARVLYIRRVYLGARRGTSSLTPTTGELWRAPVFHVFIIPRARRPHTEFRRLTKNTRGEEREKSAELALMRGRRSEGFFVGIDLIAQFATRERGYIVACSRCVWVRAAACEFFFIEVVGGC